MWKAKKNDVVTLRRTLLQNQIFCDFMGNRWIVGDLLDRGRFAEIYVACHADHPEDFMYIVKLEPLETGHLFKEMYFYVRTGNLAHIKDFEDTKGIKCLGIPVLLSSGILTEERRYRFLVLPKYGKNLLQVIKERGGKLSVDFVKSIAVQVLYCLEYMHGRNYIYGELKASNIVFENENVNDQVYLIDYGYAEKLFPNDRRTVQGLCYISRDSHIGGCSIRSDLEMLLYNMIDWLKGGLPWKKLDDPTKVYDKKVKYMSDTKKMPVEVRKYADYVNKLELQENPSYDICREFFLPNDPPSAPAVARESNNKEKPIEIEEICPSYGSLSHIKQVDVYENNLF